MSKWARIVSGLLLVLAIEAVAMPPWQASQKIYQKQTISLGYHLIFTPPRVPQDVQFPGSFSVEIDAERLGLELLAIVAAIVATVLILPKHLSAESTRG